MDVDTLASRPPSCVVSWQAPVNLDRPSRGRSIDALFSCQGARFLRAPNLTVFAQGPHSVPPLRTSGNSLPGDRQKGNGSQLRELVPTARFAVHLVGGVRAFKHITGGTTTH